MTPLFRSLFRSTPAIVLAGLFIGLPQQLIAQEHIVSSDAIQQELIANRQQRERNVETLQSFFGSESARKSLKKAGIDPEQVKTAVSQLSDHELAQFAAKAQDSQKNFAAGSLSNQQITYILIALATAVIVLVLV